MKTMRNSLKVTALALSSTCLVGLGLSTSIAQAREVSCNSQWGSNAVEYLEDRVGFRVPFVFCYEIDAGDTQTVTLTFDDRDTRMGDDHVIVGECDEDCSDLDLKVYDSRGRYIGQDTTSDSFAQVRVNNIYDGLTVQVEIIMYDCSTEYCGAAIGTAPVR